MTEEILDKGISIQKRIAYLKKQIAFMDNATDTIILSQMKDQYKHMEIEAFPERTIESTKYSSEMNRQVRAVLLAAKQTIRSLYEMEISKLEKEFINL